jgi:hypothetical protein
MPEETVVEWHCDFAQTEDLVYQTFGLPTHPPGTSVSSTKSPDGTEL